MKSPNYEEQKWKLPHQGKQISRKEDRKEDRNEEMERNRKRDNEIKKAKIKRDRKNKWNRTSTE
jgi:hypothetical protein